MTVPLRRCAVDCQIIITFVATNCLPMKEKIETSAEIESLRLRKSRNRRNQSETSWEKRK